MFKALYSSMLLLLLFVSPAAAQIVTNGQFYDGFTGWTVTELTGHEPSASFVVNPTIWHPNPPGYGRLDSTDPGCDYDCENFWVGEDNAGQMHVAISQVISVTPSTKYVASALFGGDGATSYCRIYIGPSSWTGMGQGETLLAVATCGGNAWGTVNGVFTASSSSHTLIIELEETGGATLGVDCVSVVEHVPAGDGVVDNMDGVWSFWPDKENGGLGNHRATPVTVQYDAPWAGWRGPWSSGTWNGARQEADANGNPSGHSMIIGAAGGPPPSSGGAGVSRNFINLTPGLYYVRADVMWGSSADSESWIACEVNRTNFLAPDLLSDGSAEAFARGESSTTWQTVQSPIFDIATEDDHVTVWVYSRLNDWGVAVDNVSVIKAAQTSTERWEVYE
jgi:hypothetical protein